MNLTMVGVAVAVEVEVAEAQAGQPPVQLREVMMILDMMETKVVSTLKCVYHAMRALFSQTVGNVC